MSVVTVFVTSDVATVRSERRFEKGIQIVALKGKLELITGVPAGSMKLVLQDEDGKTIGPMEDGNAMLGSFPIEDFMTIHVVNTDPFKQVGEFEDVSKVEKFEISQEEYEKRTDTVKAFKEKLKIGRFDPEHQKKIQEGAEKEETAAKAIKKGDRCEVRVADALPKRGTVKFVGMPEFKSGWWIGIQYDEPVGKNDGSVKGVKYFSCPPKYGGFVKPGAVTVGDFPEEDLDFSDSDDEM